MLDRLIRVITLTAQAVLSTMQNNKYKFSLQDYFTISVIVLFGLILASIITMSLFISYFASDLM